MERFDIDVDSTNKITISLNLFLLLPQPLRHLPLLAQVHPDIHPRLDPLEAGVHDAQQLQSGEGPPRQRPQDMSLLGVVDVQAVLPLQADLEGDLPDLIQ